MEYIFKNNLPFVSQWTQDIWTKFCAWLMDESAPDAIVLKEGQSSPTLIDRLVRLCIKEHGEYYNSLHKCITVDEPCITFNIPVPLAGGHKAVAIYCTANNCTPFIILEDESTISLPKLDDMSKDAIIGAMLSEVESKELKSTTNTMKQGEE
jgi:hypothetical protein